MSNVQKNLGALRAPYFTPPGGVYYSGGLLFIPQNRNFIFAQGGVYYLGGSTIWGGLLFGGGGEGVDDFLGAVAEFFGAVDEFSGCRRRVFGRRR
jgi:hypothetical protein